MMKNVANSFIFSAIVFDEKRDWEVSNYQSLFLVFILCFIAYFFSLCTHIWAVAKSGRLFGHAMQIFLYLQSVNQAINF